MMNAPISHDDAVAALCVWEEMLDELNAFNKAGGWDKTAAEDVPPLIKLWDALGVVEMRDLALRVGPLVERTYTLLDAHRPNMIDGLAFDWEFTPRVMALIDWAASELPDAETLKARYLLTYGER